MKERQKQHFYHLYLVRTKGLKSIIYRVIHNSYFDSVAFISEYGSVISIDHKGVFLDYLDEYKRKSDVIAVKKTDTFFVEENIAFERFFKIKNVRRTLFYDYRNIIQRWINKFGERLRIKWIKNLQIKNKKRVCSIQFIINMFDVSEEVSYNDKSIDWFLEHDIYDFLNLPKTFEV
ncbi:MAG: hypothetical protein CMP21_03655 [Rickettsiales bacterium]|nr:hypothetical protein [Rickettsiales bacterium]|tara:strand:+ start:7151 stop:7678 length:528 start_codon:yes stop_codon:yes gene_type:complete